MFISPAYAQAATGGGSSDLLISLVPFILIFAIMWLLIIRPQRQKIKQHEEMVSSLRRGDNVVMAGGLIGKITKVIDDHEIELQIAEGVKIKAVRAMVQDVKSKPEPAKD
jgi:preprotein translocase subunit YajC